MGFELVYCYKCQTRLTEADFQAGKALRIGIHTACLACSDELLHQLTPEQQKTVIEKSRTTVSSREPTRVEKPPTSRAAPPTTGGLKGMPTQKAGPAPAPAEESPRKPKALVIGGIAAAAVIVLVILIFVLGGESKKPGTEPVVGPGTGGTEPVGAVDAARLEAAKAALQKARQAEKATPDKLDVLVRLFDDAARAAEGTPLAAEARRASEGFASKMRTSLGDEVTSLEKEIRAKADSQDFQKALDQLDEARKRRDFPEWGRAIDRMTREINDAAAGHYVRVKAKALEEQSLRRADEVQRWKTEIARWGIKRFVDDLDKALAEAAAATGGAAASTGDAAPPVPATAEGGSLGPYELDPDGFVRHWLIAGPFPNPNQTGLRFDFLNGEDRCAPAQGGEANGLDGTRVRWSAFASPVERVNFFNVRHLSWTLGRNNVLAYAACWLQCESEKDVELRVGSDDGYRLWFGGKRIQEVRDRRGCERDRDVIPVKLGPAKQPLLIKVFNVDGGYEFMLRVTTPDGQRAAGVKVWN